jgi:putative phosphoribosyl transferase
MRFRDRVDAGRRLAERLRHYAGRPDLIVLGLPRGGIPVAAQVASALGAPLDVFLVRKLGVPGHVELAMGAIAEGGASVLNEDLVASLAVPRRAIEDVAAREQVELDRRKRLYRGARPSPDIQGKTVILIDDGLATGSTMEAAILALRQLRPTQIVVATPVGARESCDRIGQLADEVICASIPEWFSAVGQWYDDFSETSDDEVRRLLAAGSPDTVNAAGSSAQGADLVRLIRQRAVRLEGTDKETCPMANSSELSIRAVPVRVPVSGDSLDGDLTVPTQATGIVLFAHGSGSSRHSPRNQFVARVLQQRRLATLLVDLLTAAEETIDLRTARLRFDIPLLASRLVSAIDWLQTQAATRALRVGLFGASTGGGAALVAAAERPQQIAAVVSRGGRPDLAASALPKVTAPTLLIVGERDEPVIELNEEAMRQMRAPVSLQIVPGATHLFEEPGRLELVADFAADWFAKHLGGVRTPEV